MPLTSLWVNWASREVAPKMSSSSRNQRDTSYVFCFVFKKIFKFCFPLAFLMITKMTLVHTFQRKRKEIYPRHPSKALRVTPVGGHAWPPLLMSESVILTRGMEGADWCGPCLRLCPWGRISSPGTSWIPKQKPPLFIYFWNKNLPRVLHQWVGGFGS